MSSGSDHPVQSTIITVVWKDEYFALSVSETDTVAALKSRLEEHTGIEPPGQKLFHLSRKLRDDQALKELFFTPKNGKKQHRKRHAQGQKQLVLVGSSAQEISSGKKVGTANNKYESNGGKPMKRRRLILCGPRHNTAKKYGFGSIQPLQGLPNIDAATALLHRLATDPGVVYVMKKHKWKVGCLTELYPGGNNGTFGAGQCLLGLNTNMGEQISLRIRTDDLRGFEKYLAIRDTLFHELTHNVHRNHDSKFFCFMCKLQKEAAANDWTQSRGRKLNDRAKAINYKHPKEELSAKGDFVNYGVQCIKVVEEPSFEGDTQTLGNGAGRSLQDLAANRRDLAMLAAAVRLSRQAVNPQDKKVEAPLSLSSSRGQTQKDNNTHEAVNCDSEQEQRSKAAPHDLNPKISKKRSEISSKIDSNEPMIKQPSFHAIEQAKTSTPVITSTDKRINKPSSDISVVKSENSRSDKSPAEDVTSPENVPNTTTSILPGLQVLDQKVVEAATKQLCEMGFVEGVESVCFCNIYKIYYLTISPTNNMNSRHWRKLGVMFPTQYEYYLQSKHIHQQ